MLTDEFRKNLTEIFKTDPKQAIKEVEQNPQVLGVLLNSDKEAAMEKNEKIKYVNMTHDMQRRLDEEAKKLKTTQGLLIGAGVLLLLALLDRD